MTNTLVAALDLFVLYYQIVVYDADGDGLFNDWRPEHAQQGFSWRPGNVSFGTFDTLTMRIEVYLAEGVHLRRDTKRAIRVPFTVTRRSKVKIAVITEERSISVPPGEYALTYEHGLDESGECMWCVFTFVPDENAQPAVLIADSELSPPSPLLMEADPA